MNIKARWLIVLVLVALTAAGCGGTEQGAAPINANGSSAYPHETLTDWVTYGDSVVVYEIVSEKELPQSKDELASGEGLIMRELTARVVKPVWTAEGASKVPSEFVFVSNGWAVKDKERHPVNSEGVGRLEVGKQYVGPISPGSPYGEHGWYPMAHAETMQWSDGRASLGPTSKENRTEAVQKVAGLNAQQIAALLDRQTPDPKVPKDRSLSPRERWRAATGEPGPEPSE